MSTDNAWQTNANGLYACIDFILIEEYRKLQNSAKFSIFQDTNVYFIFLSYTTTIYDCMNA